MSDDKEFAPNDIEIVDRLRDSCEFDDTNEEDLVLAFSGVEPEAFERYHYRIRLAKMLDEIDDKVKQRGVSSFSGCFKRKE